MPPRTSSERRQRRADQKAHRERKTRILILSSAVGIVVIAFLFVMTRPEQSQADLTPNPTPETPLTTEYVYQDFLRALEPHQTDPNPLIAEAAQAIMTASQVDGEYGLVIDQCPDVRIQLSFGVVDTNGTDNILGVRPLQVTIPPEGDDAPLILNEQLLIYMAHWGNRQSDISLDATHEWRHVIQDCLRLQRIARELTAGGQALSGQTLATAFMNHKEGTSVAVADEAEALAIHIYLIHHTGRGTAAMSPALYYFDRESAGMWSADLPLVDDVPQVTQHPNWIQWVQLVETKYFK